MVFVITKMDCDGDVSGNGGQFKRPAKLPVCRPSFVSPRTKVSFSAPASQRVTTQSRWRDHGLPRDVPGKATLSYDKGLKHDQLECRHRPLKSGAQRLRFLSLTHARTLTHHILTLSNVDEKVTPAFRIFGSVFAVCVSVCACVYARVYVCLFVQARYQILAGEGAGARSLH